MHIASVLLLASASCLNATLVQHTALDNFTVTDGTLNALENGQLEVTSKEMRATLESGDGLKASVDFTYLGETDQVSRLGNGEIRHQFGLKLKAQDTCNLVYVMWHFEANDNKIHISVKSNPGQSTFSACRDQGYINNIKPRVTKATKPVQRGERHTLTAEINGQELTVIANGAIAWQGTLPPAVLNMTGPAGIRSDNAKVAFDFSIK